MTTLGDWLGATRDLERLDTELLAADVLQVDRAQIIAFPERTLDACQSQRLQQGAQQLRQGQPLAYVLGEREFWGLRFSVNPNVLIPRPETELLVEWATKHCPKSTSALDLGTGSGAIAVALKHERPDLAVSASDLSEGALAVAKQNAAHHQQNICFKRSDWFESLTGRWQTIISNPPYVAAQDKHLNALQFEPQSALVSGTDGLGALRTIIRHAHDFLEPNGWIALEHGYDQAAAVRTLLTQAGFGDVASLTDLAGIARVSLGRRHV